MEEMKELADHKPGFIKAMWCGTRSVKISKRVGGSDITLYAFAQETLSDKVRMLW